MDGLENTKYPKISVGIPMYKSMRFIDSICANIDAITYPNVEILLSDRHGNDDAPSYLANRYKDDPRIKILTTNDGLGWVSNFNRLLESSTGKYFRWMPHDDLFPVCNLMEMADVLEKNDDVFLVFGPTIGIDESGEEILNGTANGAGFSQKKSWTLDMSFFINDWTLAAGSFKGLFRAEQVRKNKLFIEHTYHDILAERAWVFCATLLGKFYFLPSIIYKKRTWNGSITYQWKFDWKVYTGLYHAQYKHYLKIYGWSMKGIMVGMIMYMLLSRKIIALQNGFLKRIAVDFPGKKIKPSIMGLIKKLGDRQDTTVYEERGVLDRVNTTEIRGWFSSPNTQKNEIDIYINDAFLLRTKANLFRRDVFLAGIHPSGACGFHIDIQKLGKTLEPGDSVSACTSTDQKQLENSPYLVKPHLERGNLDIVKSTYLAGWLSMPNVTHARFDVLVNDESIGQFAADMHRSDVLHAGFHPTGECGFNVDLLAKGIRLKKGNVVRVVSLTGHDIDNSPFVF